MAVYMVLKKDPDKDGSSAAHWTPTQLVENVPANADDAELGEAAKAGFAGQDTTDYRVVRWDDAYEAEQLVQRTVRTTKKG